MRREMEDEMTVYHNYAGNCWARAKRCPDCGDNDLCDVCHKHDEPRGECHLCPPCSGCDEVNEGISDVDDVDEVTQCR